MTTTRAALRRLDRLELAAATVEAARVLAAHGVTTTGEPTGWPRWLQVEVVFLAARRGRPW